MPAGFRTSQKNSKILFIVAISWGLTGCGPSKEEAQQLAQLAKEQLAVQGFLAAVHDIDAATKVGVTYHRYLELEQNAQSKEDQVVGPASNYPAFTKAAEALSTYRDAGYIWKKDFDSLRLYVNEPTDAILIERYHLKLASDNRTQTADSPLINVKFDVWPKAKKLLMEADKLSIPNS